MPIIDLADAADLDSMTRADICIVGAGLAGLVVSWRLAASRRRIVLLESGGRHPQCQNVALETSPFGGASPHCGGTQFRGFGGSTAHWGGRLLPLTAHDLGPRPYLSIDGWPVTADELAVHTAAIEQLFGVDNSPYVSRLQAAPHSEPIGDDPGVVCRLPKIPTFSRKNIARTLAHLSSRPAHIEIWLNATVFDFTLDRERGRVAEVIASSPKGNKLRVAANQFFFTAGTLETTRLLLLLQNKSESRAFSRCSVLGHFFQDHRRVEVGRVRPLDRRLTNRLLSQRVVGATRRAVHFELAPQAQRSLEIASAYLDIRMDYSPTSPLFALQKVGRLLQHSGVTLQEARALRPQTDLPFLFRAGLWWARYRQLYLPPDVELIADLRIEQAPRFDNRLTLSPRQDASGARVLALNWSPTDLDERTFRESYRYFKDYWTRSGLESVCPIEWIDLKDNAERPFIARSLDCLHPSGSARMGADPTTSVVDPHLRCHDVVNLHVASAATFPSAGSANPSLTIMQLALRAADACMK